MTALNERLLDGAIATAELGLAPDAAIRAAIRRLCALRLRDERSLAEMNPSSPDREAFLASMREGPIAVATRKANEQHYELPPEFFALMLGPRRKYSCCYFTDERADLATAEEAALEKTCQRARIADGQEILDLGCGWGSLSLWMAEKYPRAHITAVSNSAPQRVSIEAQAAERGLLNLTVVTADVNHFQADRNRFDTIVSVEMFEHARNHGLLLRRLAKWLKEDGQLFVHVFCHRELTYPFETAGAGNWMGRRFFTGGMMPSAELLPSLAASPDDPLRLEWRGVWSGEHYRRTADAWLANLDDQRNEAKRILAGVYGRREARRWFGRWRMFLLAVSELFGYGGGEEWFISHYRFQRRA